MKQSIDKCSQLELSKGGNYSEVFNVSRMDRISFQVVADVNFTGIAEVSNNDKDWVLDEELEFKGGPAYSCMVSADQVAVKYIRLAIKSQSEDGLAKIYVSARG